MTLTSFMALARGSMQVGLGALALVIGAAGAHAAAPTVTPAPPGKPALLLSAFDLATVGYTTEEFFISGTATSYKIPGGQTPDGHWDATPADTAPYATRIVVARPTDPKKFNGTVVVEWLNVSGGADGSPDWNDMHREILRDGYAYVGVSAQIVGVEGGTSVMGFPSSPLKKTDPARYGKLSHPGDAYSFDMYSQVGTAVRNAAANGILGSAAPKVVLAVGESQSAVFLTTYVNAVDPLAKVYDGFLIHSRFGPGAAIKGEQIVDPKAQLPAAKLRTDLRVPVLTFITETDLIGGGRLSGFYDARQPDNDHLRVWETPGTSHADAYTFGGGFTDSGMLPADKLAAIWTPTNVVAGGMKVDKAINTAPQHHYVVQAALWNLDRWVRTGHAPTKAPPMKVTPSSEAGKAPTLVGDANGNTEGGVRTPWVDAPTAHLGGVGNSGTGPAMGLANLAGVTEPFDATKIDSLYPGGKADYLKKFETSLDAAIKAGFILAADKKEIMEVAAINFHGSH